MSKLTNIWTPQLLKADAINQPIEVFLCGPGIGNKSYDARKAIRENLRSYPNVEVKYGEDLGEETLPPQRSRFTNTRG